MSHITFLQYPIPIKMMSIFVLSIKSVNGLASLLEEAFSRFFFPNRCKGIAALPYFHSNMIYIVFIVKVIDSQPSFHSYHMFLLHLSLSSLKFSTDMHGHCLLYDVLICCVQLFIV